VCVDVDVDVKVRVRGRQCVCPTFGWAFTYGVFPPSKDHASFLNRSKQ